MYVINGVRYDVSLILKGEDYDYFMDLHKLDSPFIIMLISTVKSPKDYNPKSPENIICEMTDDTTDVVVRTTRYKKYVTNLTNLIEEELDINE